MPDLRGLCLRPCRLFTPDLLHDGPRGPGRLLLGSWFHRLLSPTARDRLDGRRHRGVTLYSAGCGLCRCCRLLLFRRRALSFCSRTLFCRSRARGCPDHAPVAFPWHFVTGETGSVIERLLIRIHDSDLFAGADPDCLPGYGKVLLAKPEYTAVRKHCVRDAATIAVDSDIGDVADVLPFRVLYLDVRHVACAHQVYPLSRLRPGCQYLSCLSLCQSSRLQPVYLRWDIPFWTGE